MNQLKTMTLTELHQERNRKAIKAGKTWKKVVQMIDKEIELRKQVTA